MALSEYEKQREANIKRNQELLKSLGLDGPITRLIEPTEPSRKKATTKAKKRKVDEVEGEGEAREPAAKQVKKSSTSAQSPPEGVRRSSRNAGKVIDYRKETKLSREPMPLAYSSGVKTSENEGPLGRQDGKRIHDPKRYGSIPGIEVGTWWETRQGCSTDAIHAPWVGGIAGAKDGGAVSVALSGGYDDDVDLGYAFTYTGSGGRDLKGTKANPKNLRTAPQSSDQTFENNFNKMLLKSSETRKPVRVIRGFKLKSRYAPSEGYRYDGLYIVEKAWREKGLNPGGFLVCKFAFKRVPNQPSLYVRDDDEKEEPTETEEAASNENQDSGEEDAHKAGGSASTEAESTTAEA